MKKSRFFARPLLFVLLTCTLCVLFCLCTAAETYEGKCGENITFKYDPRTFTLTFSGKGELEPYEYTQPELPPWRTEEYGKDIKRVVIEKGITHIGQLWLSDCDIQSISIPDSAVSIHQDLFHHNLKDAPIYRQYNGADYIGNEQNPYVVLVRVHDKTATHYDIHPDTKIIHTRVFADFNDLKSVTFPANLKTIGVAAFAGCEKLTNIVLPDGLMRIDESAFANCAGLENVTLPNSITHIGDSAFHYCTKLNSINIPTELSALNQYVFAACALESIHIPANITKISFNERDGYTPYGCGGLESITVESGNPIYHSDGNCLIETASGILLKGCSNSIIPDNGSVTCIADGAFSGCNLKSIVVPQGVTSIGESAFENCKSLEAVTLATGLVSIEESAFHGCYSLKHINIPDGVQFIGMRAFCQCSELEEAILPVGVSTVSNLAFADVNKVTLLDPHTQLSNSALHRVSCIRGYENSTAHEYAKQNDIEFISLGAYTHPETTPSETTAAPKPTRGGCGSALSHVICLAAFVPAMPAICRRKKHKIKR